MSDIQPESRKFEISDILIQISIIENKSQNCKEAKSKPELRSIEKSLIIKLINLPFNLANALLFSHTTHCFCAMS